ncbi:GNAT family N-acetyltransferase [Alphaproteobacteria bacterium]|jgi:ribosomal protein S18 acetylase RimI-like enzyme|nr:GNAT family N-acetyltransferase [Alphaproteobacteria bacterium]
MKGIAIKFRAATEADLPSIVHMLADDEIGQSREDPRLPLSSLYTDAFSAINADKNQLLVVAVADGDTVVGTLQLSFVPGMARMGAWRGQIEAVRIAASHRNSGLGREMFEWAIEECRNKNCTLVQLATDKSRPDAHRFYESLGFEATHEGYKLNLL